MKKFNIEKVLKNTFSLFCICFYLAISQGVCLSSDSLYYINPEHKIADQIINSKIIMLSDFWHNHPASYNTVIEVLNAWIEIERKEDRAPQNLCLVLETDSLQAKEIVNYIRTDDIGPLVNHMFPIGGFLEDLEFYQRLKQSFDTLAVINSGRKNKIELDVKGFDFGYEIDSTFFRMSDQEVDKWFVKDRDSIVSERISKYLSRNPTIHVLVFYGGAHLVKNYVEKPVSSISLDESKGYFLAHYLKNSFGDSSVISINQKIVDTGIFTNTTLEKVKYENILIKSSNMPSWKDFNKEYFDYYVLRHDRMFFQQHSIKMIFSNSNIKSLIKYLKLFESFLPGGKARLFYENTLYYLKVLTGEEFNSTIEWESWVNTKHLDIDLNNLNEQRFREYIKKFYFSNSNNGRAKIRLSELGFQEWINSRIVPDTVTWDTLIWPSTLPLIKFHMALGVYWLGDAIEKYEAKKILKDFSGLDFDNPDLYLSWWRKKYNQCDY